MAVFGLLAACFVNRTQAQETMENISTSRIEDLITINERKFHERIQETEALYRKRLNTLISTANAAEVYLLEFDPQLLEKHKGKFGVSRWERKNGREQEESVRVYGKAVQDNQLRTDYFPISPWRTAAQVIKKIRIESRGEDLRTIKNALSKKVSKTSEISETSRVYRAPYGIRLLHEGANGTQILIIETAVSYDGKAISVDYRGTHPPYGKWYVLGLSPALIPTLEALLEPSESFRVRLKDEDLLYQEGGYD